MSPLHNVAPRWGSGSGYLQGSATHPQVFENDSQAGVASPAIPDQVFLRGVLLVAVEVSHFHIPGGTTERTDSFARWWAGIRPIA